MSDEKKGNFEEEEYQYADADLAKEVAQEIPTDGELPRRTGVFSRFANKRLLVAVVVIIAIFVVYQFLGRGKTGVISKTATTTTATKSVQTPTTSTAISEDLNGLLVKSELTMGSEINKLKAAQASDATQLRQLQNQLRGMNSSLTELQKQLTDVTVTLATLKTQIEKQAVSPKKTLIQKPRISVKPRAIRRPTYHLIALVPGRAWLRGSDGKTLTLKVGDRLQGYGLVTAILTEQGKVATSSGTIIQYGPDDS